MISNGHCYLMDIEFLIIDCELYIMSILISRLKQHLKIEKKDLSQMCCDKLDQHVPPTPTDGDGWFSCPVAHSSIILNSDTSQNSHPVQIQGVSRTEILNETFMLQGEEKEKDSYFSIVSQKKNLVQNDSYLTGTLLRGLAYSRFE